MEGESKLYVCLLTWWALMVFPGLPVGVHCLGRTVGSRWWLLLPLEGAGAPRRAYTIHPPTPALLGKHPRTSTPKNGACTKTKQEHLESHIYRIPLDNDHGKSTSQTPIEFSQKPGRNAKACSSHNAYASCQRQLMKNTWKHVSPCKVM